ncbi:MAG: hypothetical protein ACRCTJ_05635, partial [Brevinema sp.]
RNTRDRKQFTIDANGNFEIDGVKFSVLNAIDDYQAVFIAARPTTDGKTLYTYHGLRLTPLGIATVPYTTPTYEKHEIVTAAESPYFWEINTQRPENINWQSGFSTPLANRDRILEKIVKSEIDKK